MFIDQNNLRRLIEEAVEKVLKEQEEPTPDAPAEPAAPEPAPEPTQVAPTGTTRTTPTAPATTGAGGGVAGGDAADAPDLGAEGEPVAEPDDDAAAGGGGGFAGFTSGGSGGGGGGFGDDGEPGLDADQPEEEDIISTIGPEDVEIPADPIMATVEDAIKMLGQTKQPQKILQNVKSSIQRYFPEFEDATPVIKALWDTEDVVLRDVARRLLLFIKGI